MGLFWFIRLSLNFYVPHWLICWVIFVVFITYFLFFVDLNGFKLIVLLCFVNISGELVKFSMYSKSEALHCLKVIDFLRFCWNSSILNLEDEDLTWPDDKVYFISLAIKFSMCFAVSFQLLMSDFTHHNIEMACSFLESCGRFLYRHPESHHRMKVFLVGPRNTFSDHNLCFQMDAQYTNLDKHFSLPKFKTDSLFTSSSSR